jgi:hypothetical protein
MNTPQAFRALSKGIFAKRREASAFGRNVRTATAEKNSFNKAGAETARKQSNSALTDS